MVWHWKDNVNMRPLSFGHKKGTFVSLHAGLLFNSFLLTLFSTLLVGKNTAGWAQESNWKLWRLCCTALKIRLSATSVLQLHRVISNSISTHLYFFDQRISCKLQSALKSAGKRSSVMQILLSLPTWLTAIYGRKIERNWYSNAFCLNLHPTELIHHLL